MIRAARSFFYWDSLKVLSPQIIIVAIFCSYLIFCDFAVVFDAAEGARQLAEYVADNDVKSTPRYTVNPLYRTTGLLRPEILVPPRQFHAPLEPPTMTTAQFFARYPAEFKVFCEANNIQITNPRAAAAYIDSHLK